MKSENTAGAARMTPYELAFEDESFEMRIFPALLREAEDAGIDPAQPDRFPFLSVAADAVRMLVSPEAPPEAIGQYRTLLYQAFNFWRFGKELYLVEPQVARFLVEAAPDLSAWELRIPKGAIYLQLPPNLFWASVAPEAAPEPVDGFFVCCATGVDVAGVEYRALEVLMVLGIHRERSGYSLIGFDTEVGPGIPTPWLDEPGREAGEDFESVLPGGEMAGLYSIVTVPEALKLVARCLWYVDLHPGSITHHDAAERRAEMRPGSAPLTRLPYHRVSLRGETAETTPS